MLDAIEFIDIKYTYDAEIDVGQYMYNPYVWCIIFVLLMMLLDVILIIEAFTEYGAIMNVFSNIHN